jgi:hypothetical protein
MTDDMPDDLNLDKVKQLLADADNALDPQDKIERIAWCREHDAHGVRMFPNDDDGTIEFRWGNRRLALVHGDVLCGDGPLNVERQFIPDDLDASIEQLTDEQAKDGDDA